MNRNFFWEKYNLLQERCFENFNKIEKLVKNQLDEEGLSFFEDYEILTLARFETTLPDFCKACEKRIHDLNTNWLVILMLSYVHFQDNKNEHKNKENIE